MNKSQLITQVAQKTGMTQRDTEKTIEALLEALADTLARQERINLPGFGVFETRVRPPRICRNIHTGAPIQVAQARVPVFRPARQLKEKVDSCV